MLNDSITYRDDVLVCDAVPVSEIVEACGTPVYIYSLRRALDNFRRIQRAFADLNVHVHFSAKANANLAVLRTLIDAGAGIDAVSAGEIYRALRAGVQPQQVVFAGVGKTRDELRYAVEQGVGWFNVENVEECHLLNTIAADMNKAPLRVAPRLNPEVTASTHPYIATGHGGAKFGMTAEAINDLLSSQHNLPNLHFAGIHVHIGSQLHDTSATQMAVETALDLVKPYPTVRTINIGGGLPVAYSADEAIPSFEAFAQALKPLLQGWEVIIEPGRSVIADAGILVARVLYVKRQAGQTFLVVDGSMAELIRPALYQAHHEIIPVQRAAGETALVNVVGPVCETADVLGKAVALPMMQPGDLIAVLTAGAYGMVMASNYNARPRPPEVVVTADGSSWRVARERETWKDLLRGELPDG